MIEFKLPDIGEGIHEGVLLKWLVAVGDEVKEGDSLCEIETDKVNAELPAPATGKIAKLNGEVGETIYVGNVLVVIDTGEGGEVSQRTEENKAEAGAKTEAVEEDNAGVVGALEVSNEVVSISEEGRSDKVKTSSKGKVLATPVARKMAYDLGIKIDEVKGTGPNGRVMKEDIQKTYENKKLSSVEPSKKEGDSTIENEEIVKLTTLRKTISKKMTESFFTIPHSVVMAEIDVSALVEYREAIKNKFLDDQGLKITYLPFVIKALVQSLKENPKFNSQLSEDGQHLILKNYYHVGMAVDTEDGLLVPVIKNADQKGILSLMKEIDRLGEGARERKIKIEELKGSTFTITNFGSLGASLGTPIINYPEVAILGLGKIEKKPVVMEDEIVIRWMLPISVAIDHRVLDGGDAGRFLKSFKGYMEDPHSLLLL
ncbi:dihydrolipoamide acetyltransferase family protein [Alkaliphilus transvaalensis]|uniref:dihydrolipoamide acetyltransferase family protein n=1 Tax=Alkaliphilus transvaalensis TaxID=114628 RepID=UPI00047C65A5|nr:dihydrolipoamide acetyltransferase family protein [Alkaliphilus transvaalensis]